MDQCSIVLGEGLSRPKNRFRLCQGPPAGKQAPGFHARSHHQHHQRTGWRRTGLPAHRDQHVRGRPLDTGPLVERVGEIHVRRQAHDQGEERRRKENPLPAAPEDQEIEIPRDHRTGRNRFAAAPNDVRGYLRCHLGAHDEHRLQTRCLASPETNYGRKPQQTEGPPHAVDTGKRLRGHGHHHAPRGVRGVHRRGQGFRARQDLSHRGAGRARCREGPELRHFLEEGIVPVRAREGNHVSGGRILRGGRGRSRRQGRHPGDHRDQQVRPRSGGGLLPRRHQRAGHHPRGPGHRKGDGIRAKPEEPQARLWDGRQHLRKSQARKAAGRPRVCQGRSFPRTDLVLGGRPEPVQLHHLQRPDVPAAPAEQGLQEHRETIEGRRQPQGFHRFPQDRLSGGQDLEGQHREEGLHRRHGLPDAGIPVRPRLVVDDSRAHRVGCVRACV
mmetsp:Transcript_7410/g.17929  ORF Transcript_7410/g.17929 Transcript_7410/m.17929 type:complete len:442 (-) Transcript_7410:208-1533(-)